MSAGFQCKKFYVAHDQCAMKVGTDGLILGACAPLPPAGSAILDIGAGSGLLSLMLAQRTAGANPIDAVELDPVAAQQAKANVANSPWPDSIHVIRGDILTYQTDKRYRLIVSNPPFFQQALPATDSLRHQARHNDSLPFAQLLDKASELLAPQGEFALVLPVAEAAQLLQLAQPRGWQLHHCTDVFSKAGKAAVRQLLLFGQSSTKAESAAATVRDKLVIHQAGGDYSAEYRALLRDFYLRF